MCFTFAGCAGSSLPITDASPSVTLPPAEVSYVAPIGDASLEYMEEATLYLPNRDGISLSPVSTQIAFSPVRTEAETLVRALLAHAGTKDVSSVGGSTKLTLYGTSPVETSRDVVTVNLGASALQLDRDALFLACQSITNTLTQLDEIRYVNILVVNKPVGLDIANTLPMGAYQKNSSQDLGAVYNQLLSRRNDASSAASGEPFSANVTLYFPLAHTEGIVSEVRSMSFENQVLSEMVIAILRELAAGPSDASITSPALPLLADLLTTTPVMTVSQEYGGSVIKLDFAHNLEEMLDAYGISHRQSMASICYTLATFLPNVTGISVSINGTPVDLMLRTEEEAPASAVLPRESFSDMLFDYCTLYFANAQQTSLIATLRPVPYRQRTNPRTLLAELSKGPLPQDSHTSVKPVLKNGSITDTDILGFSLSDSTLLVNFSPTFERIGEGIGAEEERMLVYSIVNTLCLNERIKSVCFFLSGSQFEGFSGEIYWAGLFYPLPSSI